MIAVFLNSIRLYLSRNGKEELKQARTYFALSNTDKGFSQADWQNIHDLLFSRYWQVRWTILRVLKRKPKPELLIDYTHALPRNTFAPLEKAQYLKDLRTLRIPPEDAIDVVRKGFANPYWEVRRESVQFLSHFGNTELYEDFLSSFWRKNLLRERHYEVKMQLPAALSKITPINRILPLFQELLDDDNWKVRQKTILAMYDSFLRDPFPLKNIIRDMDLSCKDFLTKSPLRLTYLEIMKNLGE